MADNVLYYGDNLDVLRRHVKDESVDLVYLDPPFNSAQSYNVLFAEHDGTRAAAQIKAFEDTWGWDESAARAYQETVEEGGAVSLALQAFRTFLGDTDMLAYLCMMAPRLVELRRVLRSTGSIYLHCDPTASHYLKILMDAIFGAQQFRNEIAWKRTPFAGSSKARARQFPRSHDALLFYSKGGEWTWNPPTRPYSPEYLERFKHDDGDGRGPYRKTLLKTFSKETFARLKQDNRLVAAQREGAQWSYKQYLSESPGGTGFDDLWTDVNALNPMAQERLGYPTQKPEALLVRIIEASSNPGDVVLDPFCGCGTAIAAAQKLGRKWLGIDVTHLAIGLIKHRLLSAFGEGVAYKVVGEPTDIRGAEELARTEPFQFQAWALGLCGARTATSARKGADKGIDGRQFFHIDNSGKARQVIFSVKAGNIGPQYVRDLRGVLEREKAEIGVLISMQEPTGPMRKEAASAGFYDSPYGQHPRLQVVTVGELLGGKRLDLPPIAGRRDATFKKAPKAEVPDKKNRPLPF